MPPSTPAAPAASPCPLFEMPVRFLVPAVAEPPIAARSDAGERDRRHWRWLPDAGAPASAPLVVECTAARFDRRADALTAVTNQPHLPDCLSVRTLYPPTIGDATAALRADLRDGDDRYVLYAVDLLAGMTVVTITAVWRWPAGTPAWLYDRAREAARRLEGDRG